MPLNIRINDNICFQRRVSLKIKQVASKTVKIFPPANIAVLNEILGDIDNPL